MIKMESKTPALPASLQQKAQAAQTSGEVALATPEPSEGKRQATDYFLTTEELAVGIKSQPGTIRRRHSQTGSYFGLKPKKLPSGRLAWPPNAVELLLNAPGAVGVSHD